MGLLWIWKNWLGSRFLGAVGGGRNEILENKTDVADKLNDCFVNIVETATGKKPHDLTCSSIGVVDETTTAEIVERYENHETIKRIRSNHSGKDLSFSFHSATRDDIIKIIQNMRPQTINILKSIKLHQALCLVKTLLMNCNAFLPCSSTKLQPICYSFDWEKQNIQFCRVIFEIDPLFKIRRQS